MATRRDLPGNQSRISFQICREAPKIRKKPGSPKPEEPEFFTEAFLGGLWNQELCQASLCRRPLFKRSVVTVYCERPLLDGHAKVDILTQDRQDLVDRITAVKRGFKEWPRFRPRQHER